jgi:hypothetical protein
MLPLSDAAPLGTAERQSLRPLERDEAMKTKSVWPVWIGLGLVLGACDPANNGSGDDSGVTPAGSSEGGGTTETQDPTEPGPGGTGQVDTGEQGSSGDEGSTSDGNCNFLCPPDGGPGTHECDMFAQDCLPGEKCMPWANDGGNAWNATRCSPISENPGQPGDECSVEGSGVSGLDDCDIGSMCWDVDPETNMGTCVAMCAGDEANPVCEDPSTACVNVNDGAIVLCLPSCDPLLQDCPEGQACYGINEVFTCVPDASGEMGVYGDPCEYINVCDPGLFCANADAVPGCVGSLGCCSEFCDLENEAGNAQCSGAAGGQECVAWTEDPSPGFEAVGACVIPA